MASSRQHQPACASKNPGSPRFEERRGCGYESVELLDPVAAANLSAPPPMLTCMQPATSDKGLDSAANCFAIGTPTAGSEDAGASECSFCSKPGCVEFEEQNEDSLAHFTIGTPQRTGCQVQVGAPSFCLSAGDLPRVVLDGENLSPNRGQLVELATEEDETGADAVSDFSDSELDLPDESEFNWYTRNVR